MQYPTRIVFLDIDGVIAGYRQWLVNEYYDPCAVKLLKQLQDQHQFLFVLSSSHRKLHSSASAIIDEIYQATGIHLKFHPDWKTPHHVTLDEVVLPKEIETINHHYRSRLNVEVEQDRLSQGRYRGLEILKWIQDHQVNFQDVLVLDDDRDIYPIPLKHFIYIKQGEICGGLQVKHYDKIDDYYKRNTREFQRNKKQSQGESSQSMGPTIERAG